MKFFKTPLNNAYIIEIEPITDERGSFARTWCQNEISAYGLNPRISQCNISFNKKKGTLRGMHYQVKPFEEAKLVICTRGVIYDVIIDLRIESETYKKWFATKLSETNNKMLYVPEGFAHGFQTLKSNSEVFYQISEFYSPEHSKGIRWDDTAFSIQWPLENKIISQKDQQYPDFLQ